MKVHGHILYSSISTFVQLQTLSDTNTEMIEQQLVALEQKHWNKSNWKWRTHLFYQYLCYIKKKAEFKVRPSMVCSISIVAKWDLYKDLNELRTNNETIYYQ